MQSREVARNLRMSIYRSSELARRAVRELPKGAYLVVETRLETKCSFLMLAGDMEQNGNSGTNRRLVL